MYNIYSTYKQAQTMIFLSLFISSLLSTAVAALTCNTLVFMFAVCWDVKHFQIVVHFC